MLTGASDHATLSRGARRASGWVPRLGVPAAIVALVLVAYYRRFYQFGLYGDDPGVIGGAMGRSWAQVRDHLWFCATHWPAGRPVGTALNLGLLPTLVFRVGGLSGLHVAAFGIWAVNALLLYGLVLRFFPAAVAFAAGAFYALSPASTVQLQLVFVYHLELALTVGLLAAHAAVAGRRLWFAALAAIAFTMYESAAMVALALPPILALRDRPGLRPWVSSTARHVAAWVAVLVPVLLLRRRFGDPWGGERVSEMAAAPAGALRQGLVSVRNGLATHASLLAERLVQPLREADRNLLLVVAAGTLLALATFAALTRRAGDARREVGEAPWTGAAVLFTAGLAGMVAVYLTYFRLPWYPATARSGFLSGVHLLAAPGAALVLAGVVQAAGAFPVPRVRWSALVASALAIGLLCGFGNLVQREYASTWKTAKEFWQAYRHLCRDATARTFVLVLDRNLPPQRFVELFSWGSEVLPDQLFAYPESGADRAESPGVWGFVGRRAPVVIFTGPDLTKKIRLDGAGYHWIENYYWMLPKNSVQQPKDRNVIVLEREPAGWRRVEGVVPVDGGTLTLRPAGGDLLDHVPVTTLARVFGL